MFYQARASASAWDLTSTFPHFYWLLSDDVYGHWSVASWNDGTKMDMAQLEHALTSSLYPNLVFDQLRRVLFRMLANLENWQIMLIVTH